MMIRHSNNLVLNNRSNIAVLKHLHVANIIIINYRPNVCLLKAKKINGFNSCIVISAYPLDIPSIKKASEYRND